MNSHGSRSHAFSKSGKLFDRFTLELERDQSRRDLAFGRFAIEQSIKEAAGFASRKIFAPHQTWQDIFEHSSTHSFKKFASSFLPSVVMIDSG